jgi:signal transduction histidine kinase
MEELLCPWEAPQFLIFSENVPTLLFYSHFTAIIAALAIGLLVYSKNKDNIVARILLTLFLLFSFWVAIDVPLWASNRSDIVLFLWSLQILVEPIIYAIAFYLFYAFTRQKFPSFAINAFISLLLIPLILFLPTSLNLVGINTYDCDATEGPMALYYTYLIEALFISGIIIAAARMYPKLAKKEERLKMIYFALGLIIFLIAFTSGNIVGSITGNWDIAQYGLFGMPIFVGFLGYLIVQFKVYNINIIGAQALVITLWFLIGSLLFVAQSPATKIVAGFTLLSAVVLGFMLVKSIKRIVKQKEEIEKLAKKLEAANEQLKVLDKMKSEFVSIASHQLRSPLTSIRGYSSMLIEGSFGVIPPKAKEAIERIAESSRFMASSVEDYLNVSRIQAGNMKYEYSDFNIKDLAERVADDTRQIAMKKGLLLTFKSDVEKRGIVHADIGKTRQVIDNLINNALKYTPKGSINIFVHDDPKAKKIYVEVSDTGIGMKPHTIESLFEKFERAENANAVNVTGTGLGLYIARKMAQEMKGDVTAASEGENRGSTFTLWLPLQM